MSEKTAIKGGEFLIRETAASDIFIPEEWNEEQLMLKQMCVDFLKAEIEPNLERIDNQEEGLVAGLLEKAGELGLLGISVPEEYGGMGMPFNTSVLICDKISGANGSFSTAFGAHTGIGTLPILLYGNQDQKEKYLPNSKTSGLVGG